MPRAEAHCASQRLAARSHAQGFTLAELAITIVLLGIVALMISQFATGAMQSYIDAERRAELVDTTEAALRRLQRDLRMALPNSVRVTSVGTTTFIEFVPVVTGGRYRAQLAGASPSSGSCGTGSNDQFNFGVADSSFSTIGPVADLPGGGASGASLSSYVVVYNLGTGFTNANVYASGAATGGNKAVLRSASTSTCETVIAFASHTFTLPSPSGRFHIVQSPVTYACNTATGRLDMYTGYNLAAAQPTPPMNFTARLVLDNITACNIVYNANAVSQRIGMVSVSFTRTVAGESVRIYHEIAVDNSP
jgi:MSHA biogenesis protein MshO